MKTKTVLGVLALVALAGGAAYYMHRVGATAMQLTGIVTTHEVLVSPQVPGRVARLLVREGDNVARDQLLVVIAPDELRADRAYFASSAESVAAQAKESEAALRMEERRNAEQIRQADAALASTVAQHAAAQAESENARLLFERKRQLRSRGVVSKEEYDAARTAAEAAAARVDSLDRQVEAARATLALAHAASEEIAMRQHAVDASRQQQAAAEAQRAKADVRLAYAEVHAPLDAGVDTLAVRAGEVVNAGQPLLTLIDPDDLWVRIDVEETYIDRVRIGDTLTVRLPSDEERPGVVFHRGVDAGFATQRDVSRFKRDIKTFELRLRVDNRDRRLAVGMTAYVQFPFAP